MQETKYKNQAEKLKDYARSLLLKEKISINAGDSLEIIDTLQRLGLGHLFEDEFNNVIEKSILNQRKKDDMYYTALRFRILRQLGYMIPQGTHLVLPINSFSKLYYYTNCKHIHICHARLFICR